jgi:putative transposase
VPKGNVEMVAAVIRTILARPDAEHVHSRLDATDGVAGCQFPQVEATLPEAEDDLLAVRAFPAAPWKKIWSTNPLERQKREIRRRRRRRRLSRPRPTFSSRRSGPHRGTP